MGSMLPYIAAPWILWVILCHPHFGSYPQWFQYHFRDLIKSPQLINDPREQSVPNSRPYGGCPK